MSETVDLGEGFRIEVQRMLLPVGQFGAQLYTQPASPRGRWKQIGPIVVAGTPEQAASDLLTALNEDLLPDVLVQS